MFLFIEDLTDISRGREFEKVYHEIYHPGLELKSKNNSDKEASFLDLTLKLITESFPISLFQERLSSVFYCEHVIR